VLSHCCDSSFCVCFFSSLSLVVFIENNIVRMRDSNLWRFLTKGTSNIRKKTVVFKWIIGSLERGWVQPSSIGTPQRGSRQVFYLAEPRDKNCCVTCCYSCAILSASTHLIIALGLILTLWRAIKWRNHLSLSSHNTLVLISLTFHKPCLCHSKLIFTGSPIHPPLYALSD
jgi:hypothetical protein